MLPSALTPLLVVFLGAGTGGVIRHLVNVTVPRLTGADFPFATFLINVTGSFLIGLIAGWLAFKAGEGWSQTVRLFLVTGILGGYTTFSTFSLDAMVLMERGAFWSAAAYVAGSVGLSLIAAATGLALVRAIS